MGEEKKPKVGDRVYNGIKYAFQGAFTNKKDMEQARDKLKEAGYSTMVERVAGQQYGLWAIKREKPAKAAKKAEKTKGKKSKKERKAKKVKEAPATQQEAGGQPATAEIEEAKKE